MHCNKSQYTLSVFILGKFLPPLQDIEAHTITVHVYTVAIYAGDWIWSSGNCNSAHRKRAFLAIDHMFYTIISLTSSCCQILVNAQILFTSLDNLLYVRYVSLLFQKWHERYFLLRANKMIEIHKSRKAAEAQKAPRRVIDLRECISLELGLEYKNLQHILSIGTFKRTFFLAAPSNALMLQWGNVLEKVKNAEGGMSNLLHIHSLR